MTSTSAMVCIDSVSTSWKRLLTSVRIGMRELLPGPSFSTRAVTSARSCSCWVTGIWSPLSLLEELLDLGHQRLGLHRLGLELVDGDDLAVLVDVEAHRGVDAGEHDDGHVVAVLADLAGHAEAVVRLLHHDVEDEEVGLALLEPLHTFG